MTRGKGERRWWVNLLGEGRLLRLAAARAIEGRHDDCDVDNCANDEMCLCLNLYLRLVNMSFPIESEVWGRVNSQGSCWSRRSNQAGDPQKRPNNNAGYHKSRYESEGEKTNGKHEHRRNVEISLD